MTRYIALLDGKPGAYGMAFPDAPGCTAMGKTLDDVVRNATAALADWMEHSVAEGFGQPVARTIEELRADPEVVEQLADGAMFVEVGED